MLAVALVEAGDNVLDANHHLVPLVCLKHMDQENALFQEIFHL